MSGPVVSINDQYKGVVKIEVDSLTPDYATCLLYTSRCV